MSMSDFSTGKCIIITTTNCLIFDHEKQGLFQNGYYFIIDFIRLNMIGIS